MNSSTNTTATITVTTTTGTTIEATVPSRLSWDAASEYGATLTMIKPPAVNVFFLSWVNVFCNNSFTLRSYLHITPLTVNTCVTTVALSTVLDVCTCSMTMTPTAMVCDTLDCHYVLRIHCLATRWQNHLNTHKMIHCVARYLEHLSSMQYASKTYWTVLINLVCMNCIQKKNMYKHI